MHSAIEQVPGATWRRWVEEHGAIIIDVREPFEWADGTLPDSQLIPMASLAQDASNMDKTEAVLLVCRSGRRSQHAAMLLKQLGFTSVGNLAGGLVALGLAA